VTQAQEEAFFPTLIRSLHVLNRAGVMSAPALVATKA
jgi:hypothetical protein